MAVIDHLVITVTFFGPRKNDPTFSRKKTLANKVTRKYSQIFCPIGDHINGVSL